MRFFAILILLLCAPDVFAETIRLKSGATFEATVVEQNEHELIVEIPGLGRERIARSDLVMDGDSAPDSPPDADLARWGIRLVPAPGWSKLPSQDETAISFGKRGVGVLVFGRRATDQAAHDMGMRLIPGKKQPGGIL